MENDKTIEALTEELEYTEDKVIRLESKIKELKEGLKLERQHHKQEMERMYNDLRGQKKQRSGFATIDYGYQTFDQLYNPADRLPDEPQQAQVDPGFTTVDNVNFTREWTPNPWGENTWGGGTTAIPEQTVAGTTMTITNVDTNNGIVTVRTDGPTTNVFIDATQQQMDELARDTMIFGTAGTQMAIPDNPRWVMTQAERVETIVELLQRGVINENEGREILNGVPYFDRVTGERIL